MKFKKLIAVSTLAFSLNAGIYPIVAAEMSLISLANDISLRVTVDEVKYIEEQGRLADITIQERSAGCLSQSRDSDERTLTLSLEGTRFTFSSLPKVTLSNGYLGMATPKVEYLDSSQKVIAITMPRNSGQVAKGQMTLSGIGVKGLSSSTGDLYIKVGCLADEEEYSEILAAKIAEYGVTLKPARDYSLTAGGSQNVTFAVTEIMPDSLSGGRSLEVSLDKGYFKSDASGNIDGGSIYLNGNNITSQTNMYGYDENGYITSFEIDLPEINQNKINTLTFKNFEVCAGIKESGTIQLTVGGRGVQEPVSAPLADIDSGADISITPVSAAVGVKRQVGGAVTISEQGKRNLELGYINIEFEGSPYVNFTKIPNVEVTSGDLEVKTVGWSNNADNKLVLRVTKKSTVASTIRVSDFTFTVEDTAPNGTYGVDISGSAISPEDSSAAVHFDNFMSISEIADSPYNPYNNSGSTNVNTNTNTNNNTTIWTGESQVTQFAVGSKNYTVNGIINQMDAAPFAQDGRTMVPVRYVAVAAGIDDDDITYKNGIITIAGEKIIYMYLNSKVIMVDGVVSTMATQPVVINQRTYVPVAEIAKVLDLEVDWNQSTQTATFIK